MVSTSAEPSSSTSKPRKRATTPSFVWTRVMLTLMFVAVGVAAVVIASEAINNNQVRTCNGVKIVEGYILRHTQHPNDPALNQFRVFVKDNC